MLLDCGSGVFGKLRAVADHTALDAVILSHLHGDHVLDLFPFGYALTLGSNATRSRPPLIAPAGATELFRRIGGAWGSEHLIERAFEITEYDLPGEAAVGTLSLRLREVPHYIRTAAIDFTSSVDGARFTYGADCAPNDALVELAHGTPILIAEATLSDPEPEDVPGGRGHMTAAEAGELGRRAGARRLVLTHISDQLDLDQARAQAAAAFGADVELAAEGSVLSA